MIKIELYDMEDSSQDILWRRKTGLLASKVKWEGIKEALYTILTVAASPCGLCHEHPMDCPGCSLYDPSRREGSCSEEFGNARSSISTALNLAIAMVNSLYEVQEGGTQ